ncbi:MAG: TolC family protein [Balneolaceae bacterium]
MAHRTGFLPLLFSLLFVTSPLQAQPAQQEFPEEISITVEEAIQLAIVNNYLLRKGLLDRELADAQIREAWGSVYPQVNASGSYNRNILSPNPFAGSDAGGLFGLFGSLEWLAYNERARTDGDSSTEPIDMDEFFERQQDGYQEAGITQQGGDNPFAVDNTFNAGVSITQTIYNGAAFAAIKGARQFKQMSEDQLARDQQIVVDQIRSAFYSALLAREQVQVLRSSVGRLQKTVEETRAAVEAGVLSRYDRMSAEVELVNLETNLIEAENQAELAVKNLTLQLGIPVQTTVQLRGELAYREELYPEITDIESAYRLALERRPDISQTDAYLDLLEINNQITRARYLPTVNAFANTAYVGQVPDNRRTVSQVEGEDFQYTSTNRGFFDDSYWYPSMAVGLQFQWSLFNGFQTRELVQQGRIELKQAEIDHEQQKNGVYIEVDQALRALDNATRRIRSQQRNIEQAEANYENARRRLQEGVGTSMEERQASSLLDQSQLNYLSAVHDFLTAVSRYETATGKPVLAGQP